MIKTITCHDRISQRIDDKIKKLVFHKNQVCNNDYFLDRNNTDIFKKPQSLQAHLKTTFEESKQKYCSCLFDQLLDSKTSQKSCWLI